MRKKGRDSGSNDERHKPTDFPWGPNKPRLRIRLRKQERDYPGKGDNIGNSFEVVVKKRRSW